MSSSSNEFAAAPNRATDSVSSESAPGYEVVICTYNGARYISRQLESVIHQSLPPTRISIYDDCSTDQTVRIAERLLEDSAGQWQGSCIIRRNNKNLGYAFNFQQGLERAGETYVLLCDQDDVWMTHKAESLLHKLKQTGADLVFSDGVPIDEDDRAIGRKSVLESYGLAGENVRRFNEKPFDFLVRRNFVNGAAAAINLDSVRKGLPVPKGIPHDFWLALWAAAHGGIVCVPTCLYGYRQHQNNVIGLGAGGKIGYLRSAWRHPIEPRERELAIWSMVATRVDERWSPRSSQLTQQKLDWMKARFAAGDKRSKLIFWIGASIVFGRYAKFTIGRSILRDIASMFRK